MTAALAAGAILVSPCAGSAATRLAAVGLAPDPQLARWDPAIRYGVLPNGLRYAVQHNATPRGAISLRLSVGVGSFDEADDERGAAHMVEHLAFDGSKSFPDHQLDLILAPLHVTFAHDRNASSDIKQTAYQMDLPSADASELDVATRWLRDVADGLTFTDAAVARERAAMEAERKARDADELRVMRARMDAFQDGDLRTNARFPLGAPESLAALTAAKLQAFYGRWYRPDNAVVVMVGDLPLDVLEQKVRAVFGDWQAKGPPPQRAPREGPTAARGAEALVLTEPDLPSVAGICRIAPLADGPTAEDRLHALLLRGLWEAILQKRIAVLKSRKDAPFIEATINDETRPDSQKTCVGIIPRPGQEVRAVGMIEGEIRRFAAEGPTVDETDAGLEQVRASVRLAVDGPAHDSRARATDLLFRMVDRLPQLAPREGLKVFDVMMEDTGPAEVRAAFARDWSGWGPLAPVSAPKPLSEQALVSAMTGDEYKSTGAK
ncbi:MAG: insulinase family protein [Proteobacteria bacterium]|nr:insulinase family protein [Pseudomonadota bacterium]